MGNYGLGLQMHGKLDVLSTYAADGNLYHTIPGYPGAAPALKAVLVLLVLSMITFYSTSFDSITVVASTYTTRS